MSITTKLTATLAATCLLLLTTVFSTSAYAIGIPGSSIPESGEPFFLHSVKVRANRGSWSIDATKGNADFQLGLGGGTFLAGTGGKYTLNATFDKNSGIFVSGNLTVEGKISDLGINSKTTLMTANLTAFDFDELYDNKLIGFKTDITSCYAGLGFTCTDKESIWIMLDAAFCYVDDDDNTVCGDTTARLKNAGTAITTLPLPAAVWLFGSGLVFLAATGRRRSARQQQI